MSARETAIGVGFNVGIVDFGESGVPVKDESQIFDCQTAVEPLLLVKSADSEDFVGD